MPPPAVSDSVDDKPASRSKLACTTCRAIKVRCIRSPDSGGVCTRCSRYGLQCSDPPVIKRKGRPPNSVRRAMQEAAAANGGAGPSHHPSTEMQPSSSRPKHQPGPQVHFSAPSAVDHGKPPPGLFPVGFPGYPDAPSAGGQLSPNLPTAMAQSLVDLSRSKPLSSHSGQTATVSPTSGTHPSSKRDLNLNMAEFLDPAEGRSAQAPFYSIAPARRQYEPDDSDEEGAVSETDDPVSLHALSEVEANSLVQLFHERLNPLVAVLDAQLHTMAYLRRTSTVLFSTVLASSSRFFRHDLHPALISHARTLLDRALLAGSSDIGVVQSLMILTYWKDPDDTSGWMKVGMAIRLGYSLFWHIPRRVPLPDDERDARKLLNAERTWFCLFAFDRGQSYIHGLPATIRLNEHSDIWAREHLHLGPSVDMHIAVSIQLCKLKDNWGALCEMKASDRTYLELTIETLTTQCDALIDKWFNKEGPPPGFDPAMEHVVLWSILDFVFIMKRYRHDMYRNDPLRLDACLEVISRIAEEVDILAGNGMLVIMQDSASCMTSSMVAFMRKVFRQATRSQKSFILTILHRILLAHASVTNEESKTAPAYVARFIRRVLSALSAESRAPSPGAAETDFKRGATHHGGQGVDFFAELGLEEFMHVPEYVAQNEADDGRYCMLLSEVLPNTNMG